ncbi:hypothetical protein HYU22_02470 [Candidatus Woesearchaeota archaeon]|nr:hypothetical protein [Candidatus Woesearchaeota archaeon]
MTPRIPRERLEQLMWKPTDGISVPEPPEPIPGVTTPNVTERVYELMGQTSTYALGVHALQEACSAESSSLHPMIKFATAESVYRPLTFRENIEARVKEYQRTHNADGTERTKEERLHLFGKWLDSCTGLAYKAQSTQFKIVPLSQNLITIDKDFRTEFLPVGYDGLTGVELDSSRGVYNTSLTKAQVVDHPAWRAAVDDVALLREYATIVFSENRADKQMWFWVRQNTPSDELRALFVSYLNSNSYAGGSNNLYIIGSFLRVAPSSRP